MKYARQLLRFSNLVPILAIFMGFLTSTGLTDEWYPPDKMMMALIAIVALELLIQRIETLESLKQAITNYRPNTSSIELLSRTNKSFESFPDFVKGASEVMVIGVDLAFMAKASAWFIKESIESGLDLKLIIINPNTSGQMETAINIHDERNTTTSVCHDHVKTANDVINELKNLVTSSSQGKLEIKSRVGIPSPSITLVDPTKSNGKIRVELKLYKRNQGPVPYFTLTRNNEWYNSFFEHYYVTLWNDCETLYVSK